MTYVRRVQASSRLAPTTAENGTDADTDTAASSASSAAAADTGEAGR